MDYLLANLQNLTSILGFLIGLVKFSLCFSQLYSSYCKRAGIFGFRISKTPLQASDVVDRETEILQLEEKAIDGLKEEDTGGGAPWCGFGGIWWG